MKINSINLNNFKCFSDKVFAFGSRVEISGRNGIGKSTIREAILFTIYNRTEIAVKETDKYIKNGEDFCEVTLNADVGTIKRQRGKSKSKLWLNEHETTQENLVAQLNLPEFAVFNSVFTAGYFMKLDEKTQRQIILDLTEPVDRLSIYNKLGGKLDQRDFEIDLDDLDGTFKMINAIKNKTTGDIKLKTAIVDNLLSAFKTGKECPICIRPYEDKQRESIAKKNIDDTIKKIKKESSELEESQVKAKDLLDILKKIPQEEIKIKLEFLGPKLNEYVPNSEIVLMELLKSAMGYKPVFKFYMARKEYKFLSTGERKTVDVGICEFLNGFCKLDMMFIDNMESITNKLPIDFRQVFTSRVDSNELKVAIK